MARGWKLQGLNQSRSSGERERGAALKREGPAQKTGQRRVKDRKVVRFQPPNAAFI